MAFLSDVMGMLFPVSQGLTSLINGQSAGNNPFFGEHGLLSNPTGAWDIFKNGRTNEVNKEIAEENLDYQRERNAIEDARYEEETAYNRAFAEGERDYQHAFAENEREYQRALQQQIFEREDTAFTRQAEQLSSMGINPLSQTLNGAGAGQALSPSVAGSASAPGMSSRGGTALHNDFQMQDQGLMSIASTLMTFLNGVDQLNTNGLQRDKLTEEINYQQLLNESQAVENEYKEQLLQSESTDKKATAERNERVNQFQKDTKLNDIIGNRPAYAPSVADTAWIAEQTKTSMAKNEDSSFSNPLKTTGNKIKDSLSIVGNALSDTLGDGAKKIYNFFTKNKKKYRTAKQGRQW